MYASRMRLSDPVSNCAYCNHRSWSRRDRCSRLASIQSIACYNERQRYALLPNQIVSLNGRRDLEERHR